MSDAIASLLNPLVNLLVSPAFAEGAAPAARAPQGSLLQFLPLVILMLVMYFLMIRPQQKKAKEHRLMVDGLKKGDEVVTQGGLLAKVVDVNDTFIAVKLADNVQVNIQRQAVASLMPKGTIKENK